VKDKGNRKNKGSLLKVMLLINSSFLLALTLFIILFSYHHYTEVIDLNQKKLYSEKLNTLVALCERKNERLERTGVPDAYRDDFQSQTLKQIADLNEDNDPRLRPIILNSTGDFLFPQNPNKKSSELIRYSFSDTQINSYSGKDEKTIYGISFKPWNWSILYSVPHSLKYEDRSKLLSNLLPISMLLFILISIVAGKLIRTKLQPISQLNQAAQSMAAGNLGITIHNTSGGGKSQTSPTPLIP
jgi:methyl-accepting chemotaxis protein